MGANQSDGKLICNVTIIVLITISISQYQLLLTLDRLELDLLDNVACDGLIFINLEKLRKYVKSHHYFRKPGGGLREVEVMLSFLIFDVYSSICLLSIFSPFWLPLWSLWVLPFVLLKSPQLFHKQQLAAYLLQDPHYRGLKIFSPRSVFRSKNHRGKFMRVGVEGDRGLGV